MILLFAAAVVAKYKHRNNNSHDLLRLHLHCTATNGQTGILEELFFFFLRIFSGIASLPASHSSSPACMPDEPLFRCTALSVVLRGHSRAFQPQKRNERELYMCVPVQQLR